MRHAVSLLAVAFVAVAWCTGAPGAGRSRLALMPLPKAVLGAGAGQLVLASDSGVDTNADAATHAGPGVTGADLARAGRISGYTLDYTVPPGTAVGTPHLLGVQTIAELYRSERAAVKGLAFWRRATTALSAGKENGVAISPAPFAVRLGDAAFAFELTYRSSGVPVGYIGDVVFRDGDLLGVVFVTSNRTTGLRSRTAKLGRLLLIRIGEVEAGKFG